MGRLGTRDPEQASAVRRGGRANAGVELAGAMTHFATADELEDEGFFAEQLDAFTALGAAAQRERRPELLVHAANSAAMLREPSAQFDMVRCGIAVYGMDPFGEDPAERALEPALELHTYLADVKLCRAGESAGYGRRFIAERDTLIGVLPDRLRRRLAARRSSNNCDVLIGGRAPSARGHGQHGQRRPSTSAPDGDRRAARRARPS